jgi:hypothetical protein
MSFKQLAFAALTFCLIFDAVTVSRSARANEAAVKPAPTADEPFAIQDPTSFDGNAPTPGRHSRLTLRSNFTLSQPGDQPLGFSSNSTAAPYELEFLNWRAPAAHRPAFLFQANATFARESLAPGFGITPSVIFRLNRRMRLEVELDLQEQKTLRSSPYRNSVFDTYYAAGTARFEYDATPALILGIAIRDIYPFDTPLGNFEGMETTIAYNNTYVLSPNVTAWLPGRIRGKARADIYFVGDAAIASKEFGVSLPRQSWVVRWKASFERRFLRKEPDTTEMEAYRESPKDTPPPTAYDQLGVEAGVTLISGLGDKTALYYQAPFFAHDYLLSTAQLTLGVSWYF